MATKSPEEQEDFLQHGRFGEGQPKVRRPLSPLVKAAMVCFGLAIVSIAVPVLLHIGRDDGSPFFLLGAIFCFAQGLAFAITAGVRELLSRNSGGVR